MQKVKPKKHLGQHFLKDLNIARKIADSLKVTTGYSKLLEIGPGTGVLTQFLFEKNEFDVWCFDVDKESIAFLHEKYPDRKDQVLLADFLREDLSIFKEPFGVIGNFPYNISSQIFFRVLEYRNNIPEVVGMIQKEVADRLVSPPGNKQYGILSVLLQTFYKLEYLFTVEPGVFIPPPKVRSAVIRLERNERNELGCDEGLYFKVVKQGFQNRRKTLRNSLKPLNLPESMNDHEFLNKRAEQLSVEDFIKLTKDLEQHRRENTV
ncbi:16S rRNA (adenine(1518)-N(6)/adenine(1519)-N(6))-dimethyltransferase RsmA [Marinigracilibium pacificum]|uniref:Ribosomal RNA small subunit methyltransferase A n=1 Tax=Marinigracilibium pacificum TaxID=2729599 RepID=A0A848J2A7_9BACT|nr:16S rRNA (adenine(1518)-N(6)/adenine(1519)-N(6))-dimethyltransferase RsmA [Marinigracilibium pacificum]NMM50727.1 16S rRNA (adenine(1518)-N(6)/adenine(1519)-N(6))-dimethyltransferase RsmA [Marinigracilibium pacificum]